MSFLISRALAAGIVACLCSVAATAQAPPPQRRTINAPPTPSGATPRTPDGHPDLTGVWNGIGDNLNGVPNQMANNGTSVDSPTSAHDIFSGAKIVTFPRNTNRPLNNEEDERAAALL